MKEEAETCNGLEMVIGGWLLHFVNAGGRKEVIGFSVSGGEFGHPLLLLLQD